MHSFRCSPLVFVIVLCTNIVSTERIIIYGIQVTSHTLVKVAIGSELVLRGHDVYMVMNSRLDRPEMIEKAGIKILSYHVPKDAEHGFSEAFYGALSDKAFLGGFIEELASRIINDDCTFMMADENFKSTAKALNFSLAILEPCPLGECNLILGHYLEIPFVSMSTAWSPWDIRLPSLPSFSRVLAWLPIADETTFMGRVLNLIEHVLMETQFLVPFARNYSLLNKYAPELHSWGELVRKSELILTDVDHHIGEPMPAFPYYVGIPGLTTRPAGKLDPEWEVVLNGNENGIVVMGFGSLMHAIPRGRMLPLFEAFSRLNQTVVARMNALEGIELPKNVKITKWFPQNDFLGHPNTKLFITHCGISGTHEMLYHGVPFVGLPMFYDQDMNCQQAEDKGFGIKLNAVTFTSEELFAAMVEVLGKPKYKSAVKRGSEIFRDQPMNGRQKAAFWIEHVLKFGGGHLRSRALDLPLYQFLMLDIIAAFVILCFVIFELVKFLLKKLIKAISYWNFERSTKQHDNSRGTKKKSS